MSKATYTPGPWFVFGNGHCVGGPAPDGVPGAQENTAGVAMCGLARRSPEERVANARLVAAAPDLLEACQEAKAVISAAVLGFVLGQKPTRDAEQFVNRVIDTIDAAVAKALKGT